MFKRIPFVKTELQVVEEIPNPFGMAGKKVYRTPVTPRQNLDALYVDKHPFWIPLPGESSGIQCALYNKYLSRGMGADMDDVFGVHWKFVPEAGGSISVGDPILEDVNDWKEKILIPNIDEWDWEADCKDQKIDMRFGTSMTFINGFWFERLISFMEFMPAAMALIDEEQVDALHELFGATTELACRLVDKLCEYYPELTEINVHDDWGAQKAPFFSMDVANELFVPYMKKLTDHIHAKGRIATLHSCGHNADRIQCYIDGGFDQWSPQPMNDIEKLYELYGDKIVLGVWPKEEKWEELSEEKQRQRARAFVEQYSKPGKPVTLSIYAMRTCPPAFLEEVYEYSRKVYYEQA